MDYIKLSDFEINLRVAEIVVDYDCISRLQYTDMAVHWGDGANWHVFNPCNNPADAWPIINENKISTMWMTSEKEWCAWSEGDLEEGTWDWKNVPDYYFNCESQLRAAMIVFLMMQEAK